LAAFINCNGCRCCFIHCAGEKTENRGFHGECGISSERLSASDSRLTSSKFITADEDEYLQVHGPYNDFQVSQCQSTSQGTGDNSSCCPCHDILLSLNRGGGCLASL
jgi:hypothetical protein